jgi:hypothetical protein
MTCYQCPHDDHIGYCPHCWCFAHTVDDVHPLFHTGDPDTSAEAAASTDVQADRITMLGIHVRQIELGGGDYPRIGLAHFEADALDADFARRAASGNSGSPARKRGSDLKNSGFLVDTGERRINPVTGSSNNAVWKLTSGGVKEHCRIHGITPSGPLAAYIAREGDQYRQQPRWDEGEQASLWD